MKTCLIAAFLFLKGFAFTFGQTNCDVLVQIIQGVECRLPMVVSTGEILMPCSAPDSFFNLPVGSFAKISYTPATCVSFCMQGTPVDITCFEGATIGLPAPEMTSQDVRFRPNPASGEVFVENFVPEKIQVFDGRGVLVKTVFPVAEVRFSVKGLPPGAYLVKLSSREMMTVKKLMVD